MCAYVGDTNGRLGRGHHVVFTHDFVSVQRIVISPHSDWPACAVDVVERPQDLVQLERARLGIYMVSLASGNAKRREELTETPAPRSPSLRPGSLSMMRTSTPFLRKVSARTRPEGPAPL
jgi:hypothetical protein